ncbi:hypothetical protein [aff. Roholtiella sp. LEGE 12411]|uniref:hypothetical protein n=1 Tax=aff. Roholtiella sp. LEGE 12411 TaxID=1828822 RepID=UPI001FC8601E|nr:hypothetical protein [aff. Roholtiella sp. LEGE 12411]
MISLRNSEDSRVSTTVAIKRLARAMTVSAGEFSLVLACCNCVKTQQQILNSLIEFSPANIQDILLTPEIETLYTTIKTKIGDTQPEALMVRGLESVLAINQLITSTNLIRNEFQKKFRFPLVLWINDEILRKLVWLAPDFKDWAASTIRFDVASNQLIEFVVKAKEQTISTSASIYTSAGEDRSQFNPS